MSARTLPPIGLLLAAAVLAIRPAAPARGVAQAAQPHAGSAIFRPLRAEPKEARFLGPSPYGQFYRDHVSSVGLGVGFSL
jgi:hypothetical protein